MKLTTVLLGALAASHAWAGDWRETLSEPKPGSFPLPRPYTANYKFGWGALTAADATFVFSRTPDGKLRLAMQTKTIGAVRALWRMDSQHTALGWAAALRPISTRQTEIYQSETDVAKADFRADRVERLIDSVPPGSPPAKVKIFKCANVFDLHTALLFVRSQPLRDSYRLVVFPSRSLYLAEIDVLAREKVTAGGKEYPAIKCEVKLQGVNRELGLEPHRKFKHAFAWISDDQDRLLVKIDAEVFVGSVWAELVSVKFTTP